MPTRPLALLSCLLLTAVAACDATGTLGGEDGSFSVVASSVSAHPSSSLAALVSVELSGEGTTHVAFWAEGVELRQTAAAGAGIQHEFLVLGMRADSSYSLQAVAQSGGGEEALGEELSFQTGSLPPDIPDFDVEVLQPERVQPGITVFGPARVGSQGSPPPQDDSPFLIGVDEEGEVVWYYAPDDVAGSHVNRDARPGDDGTLLLPLRNGFRLIEPDGEKLLERSGAELPRLQLHHDVMRLPGTGIVALASEVETVDVEGVPTEVKGDVLVLWDDEGEVIWEWSAFDHLPTDRFPGYLSSNTGPQGGPLDWTHGNGLGFDPEESLILLSLRHQNWVVAIRYPEGEVAWILGEEGDFELAEGAWFYSQHLPVWLGEDRVLLYDNGNERPDVQGAPYSRAVIYSIEGAVAREQWSWATDHFTTFLGGAAALDNGNVLVCAGGQRGPGLPAELIEVTGDEEPEEVWKLSIEDRVIYRSRRLPLYGGPLD